MPYRFPGRRCDGCEHEMTVPRRCPALDQGSDLCASQAEIDDRIEALLPFEHEPVRVLPVQNHLGCHQVDLQEMQDTCLRVSSKALSETYREGFQYGSPRRNPGL